MKMIASTKLAKAQRAMQAGKEYGLANKGGCYPAWHLRVASKIYLLSNRGLCSRPIWQADSKQAFHRCLLWQRSLWWYPLLRFQSYPTRFQQRIRLTTSRCFRQWYHSRRRFLHHGHWWQIKSSDQPCSFIQPRTHFQPNWSWHPYFCGCSRCGGFDHAEWCEIRLGGSCVQ